MTLHGQMVGNAMAALLLQEKVTWDFVSLLLYQLLRRPLNFVFFLGNFRPSFGVEHHFLYLRRHSEYEL